MLLLKAATPFAYAKVDKVDAEEARRLRAQYLIHKVLEESIPSAARARSSSRSSRLAARFKTRIGVRLKKLRLTVRGVRVRACRTLQRHLRSLRRLIAQQGSSGEPAAAPAASPS